MSLLASWAAFPLVLCGLSLGCGLLLDQVSSRRLPGVLLMPSGFALVVVAAGFTTLWDSTAELTVPLVIGLAILGFVLSYPWGGRRFDGWAAAAAVGTFAVYAAPIVLTGSATFAGYITLDDTATWLALNDRAMEHGRSLAGLPLSSYETTLWDYMATGYPLGAFLPLGIGHELTRQDTAWLFQPLIAVLGGFLSLGLYSLAGSLVASRPLRALVAFIAAQPALLFAYAMWSGIKEIAATALIALSVALVTWALAQRPHARDLIAIAVAVGALTTTLTLAGVGWLIAAAVGGVALAVRRYGGSVATAVGIFAVVAATLSIPAFAVAGDFYRQITAADVLQKESELGNLGEPLRKLQLLGIWPAGDFRLDPDHRTITYVLIAVLLAAGILGLVWAFRARSWALPLYLGTAALGCALFVAEGSPWIDGKAMVTASPAFVLAAMLGAGVLLQRGRLLVGVPLAVAIAGGVLWSNALAYHEVWLAPREPMQELASVGGEFAGQGPTLMTDGPSYGVRHFLRDLDPEGAAERRRRPVALRDGSQLESGEYSNIDAFALDSLLVYRTIVLRRSPTESRPPSAFALVRRGRYYDVWQQVEPLPRILEQVPLGAGYDPGSVPDCGEVERLAEVASAEGGRLVAATTAPIAELDLSRMLLPPTWAPLAGNPAQIVPGEAGTASGTISVPEAGTYSVWLGGSFRDGVEVALDGRVVGSRRHNLNWSGQYSRFGSITLAAGGHTVTIHSDGPTLRPGSGGGQFGLGPLVLSRDVPSRLVTASPAAARSLCGRTLDWIEAVSA